jgi:plastocyanin
MSGINRLSALGSRLSALGTAAAVALVLSGCAKDAGNGSASLTNVPSATSSVKLTGKVITVEMYTDGVGNYFKPHKIEAHRGDIVRFVLKAGVHNVHFLADSNPGKTGLPPASEFLQLPEQTWDLTIDFAPGHYYFQCDPHALLGMVGRLEVEDEN